MLSCRLTGVIRIAHWVPDRSCACHNPWLIEIFSRTTYYALVTPLRCAMALEERHPGRAPQRRPIQAMPICSRHPAFRRGTKRDGSTNCPRSVAIRSEIAGIPTDHGPRPILWTQPKAQSPRNYSRGKGGLVLCQIELPISRLVAAGHDFEREYSRRCIRDGRGWRQPRDCARARSSASVLTLVSDRASDVTTRWASDASTRARILRSPAATNVSTRSARSVLYTAAR